MAASDFSESNAILDAGAFGAWLEQFRASLRGTQGTNVPCGDCVGCCVSSYFIPVRSSDAEALDVIPAKWLVGAPNKPGHFMMSYLADGRCPMLSACKCSIYAKRPQTCRDYDCRVFVAAAIEAGGEEKHVINRRVKEWRFTYESERALAAHHAVQAAAKFIREKSSCFPKGYAPTASTGIAVLAVKTYKIFLEKNVFDRADTEIARELIEVSCSFDAGKD